MSTINELAELVEEPATVAEWVAAFPPEDQKTIWDAFATRTTAQVWPIVTQLDDNPFPFSRKTLQAIMAAERAGRA